MPAKGLTWKVILLVVFNDLTHSAAQLFMKKGLLHAAPEHLSFQGIMGFLAANSASPYIWIGVIIYTLSFFAWILILSRVDLSIATPMASTDYVAIPILAVFLLHEHVPPLRWLGIATIILGIYFVSISKNHTRSDRAGSC